MNDKNRWRVEAGQRCVQWIADHSAGIPVLSVFETKALLLGTKVSQIQTIAGQQIAAGAAMGAETEQKGNSREDLMDKMTFIANAARAAEPDNPGIQDRFRYRRNLNDADLLATARSFVNGDAEWGAILVAFGAGATWAADLTTLADDFETAFNEATSAAQSRSAATAEINQAVAEMMQLKRTVEMFVKNYFAGDVGALAAWYTAAHVENPPATPEDSPPPPPPDPEP